MKFYLFICLFYFILLYFIYRRDGPQRVTQVRGVQRQRFGAFGFIGAVERVEEIEKRAMSWG